MKRLQKPRLVPGRRLDGEAAAERTARWAGLLQPVAEHHHRVPDLVVLVQSAHGADQMAGLAGQLVDRLRDAGPTLHRYLYRDGPSRALGGDGRWWGLGAILDHHPGARLLIIGEPGGLIDAASGRPRLWVLYLDPGGRRGLRVTRRVADPWRRALAAAGFAVAEIGGDGLHRLAAHLRGVRRTDRGHLRRRPLARATGRVLPDDEGWGRGGRPVTKVSWEDATAYAEWLSAQTGQAYRLPSGAEWEYAARVGTTGPFWTGDCIHNGADASARARIAIISTTDCNGGTVFSAPVVGYLANAFGLHDMLGNVWEWIEDCWHGNYEGAPTDGSVWLERGGGAEGGFAASVVPEPPLR